MNLGRLGVYLLLVPSLISSCEKKSSEESQKESKPKNLVDGSSVKRVKNQGASIESQLEILRRPDVTPPMLSDITRALEAMTEDQLVGALKDLEPFDSKESLELADHILRALSVKDPKLALDSLMKLPNEVRMLSVCYTLMARKNPQLVLDWMLENRDSDSVHMMHATSRSLTELIKADPAKTINVLANLNPKVCSYFIPLVMKYMADTDPDQALTLARQNFKGEDLKLACVGIVANLSKSDPERAIAMLGEIPETAKIQCVKTMLPLFADGSFANFESLIKVLPPAELSEVFAQGGVVEKLTNSKPETAIALIGQVPYTEQSRQLYSRLVLSLVERDPAKAVEYVLTLPEGEASRKITEQMFEKIAQSSVDDALKKVSALPASYQSLATRSIARALAKEDSTAAFKLAANTPVELRQEMYREVARQVTYSNPEDAVKILDDSKISGIVGADFRSEMLDHTVRGWAKNDLAAARSWVEDLSAADLPKGVQGLMNPWMKSDPIAASDWLAKMPAGPARDAGARVIIEQIKNTDPQMAEQWRKSLSQSSSGQN